MFARSAPLLRRTLLGAGLAGAALATTVGCSRAGNSAAHLAIWWAETYSPALPCAPYVLTHNAFIDAQTAFEPVRADALPAAAAGGAGRPVRAEATSPAAEDPSRGLHTRYAAALLGAGSQLFKSFADTKRAAVAWTVGLLHPQVRRPARGAREPRDPRVVHQDSREGHAGHHLVLVRGPPDVVSRAVAARARAPRHCADAIRRPVQRPG